METLLIIIFILGFIGYLVNEFDKSKAKNKRKRVNKKPDNNTGVLNDYQSIDYITKVKELKRQKEHSQAIEMLLKIVDTEEKEAKIKSRQQGFRWTPAPWAYNQLAIIYRKEKRYNDEVAILERYMQQEGAKGNGESKMEQRLKKAKELANTQDSSNSVEVSFKYNPQIITRQGIQILESLHILANTKNIDTLKGRFEFIAKLYDNFINASSHKRFVSDIQKSIDEYKATYYERIPNEYEINLLIKPDKENLRSFYIKCIFDCFKRFQDDQEKEIESLKRQDAKDRRIKKILEVAKESKTEMIEKSTDKRTVDSYINEIEQIIQAYNGYLKS